MDPKRSWLRILGWTGWFVAGCTIWIVNRNPMRDSFLLIVCQMPKDQNEINPSTPRYAMNHCDPEPLETRNAADCERLLHTIEQVLGAVSRLGIADTEVRLRCSRKSETELRKVTDNRPSI